MSNLSRINDILEEKPELGNWLLSKSDDMTFKAQEFAASLLDNQIKKGFLSERQQAAVQKWIDGEKRRKEQQESREGTKPPKDAIFLPKIRALLHVAREVLAAPHFKYEGIEFKLINNESSKHYGKIFVSRGYGHTLGAIQGNAAQFFRYRSCNDSDIDIIKRLEKIRQKS